MVKGKAPLSTLPAGWIVIKSIRKGGTRCGMVDKVYLSPDFRAFRSFVSAQRFINANVLNNVLNPVAPVPVASVANIVLVQDTPDSLVLVSDEEEEEEGAMNEIINLLSSSEDEIDDEIELLLSSDEEIEL